VFFEAIKKPDIAESIPIGQMKRKSDLKMKSEGLKESLTALKSHVESLVVESLGDGVLGIWMLTSK
jgi:hypothetical protein